MAETSTTDTQKTTTSEVPSITVYWLVDSRADRILFILEELQLPYNIVKLERGPDKLAPPELKKIHPLGKSPVIKDGEKVVAESGFIIDYLIEKYGKDKHLKPTNEEALFHYNYFMHYVEGSLMPILVMKYVFNNIQSQAPWIVKPVVNAICTKMDTMYMGPTIRSHVEFLESELGQRRWLAGDEFSGADVQASFAIEMLTKRAGVTEKDTPNIWKYLLAMRERPAYKRAMEQVGKTTIVN